MRKLFVVLLVLGLTISLVSNGILFQRYSTSRPILRFGSDAVSIKEYRDTLEYQYGKTVLTRITLTKIVGNAAKKAGVSPTKQEVDRCIADIQRRAPKQLEAARQDAIKMSQLRQNLQTDIALENLTMHGVKMTEPEIRAFYNRNPALFKVPSQASTLIVLAQSSVDAATAEALMRRKEMTPAAIASTQPRLRVAGLNFTPKWDSLPAESRTSLANAVLQAPVGGIVKVEVQNIIFVVRIDKRAGEEVTSYEKAKPQAERLARLAKAPRREAVLARLYKDASVQFEIPRYADFFRDIDAAAENAAPVK